MDEQRLTQQLLGTFVGELDEYVQSMNRDLLALEKVAHTEQRKDLIQSLFRTAHALKGASRAVNLTEVERAFHRIEEVLTVVRDGSGELQAGTLELLFSVVDALEDAGDRIRKKQGLAGGPLASLLPRLEDAARDAGGSTQEVERAPEPQETRDSAWAAVPEIPVVPGTPAEAGVARVPVDKLDRLISRNDELLLAGRQVSSRLKELLELREFVERWQRNWHGVQRHVDKLQNPRQGNGQVGGRRGEAGRQAHSLTPAMVKSIGRAEENLRHIERSLDQLGAGLTGDAYALVQAAGSMSDDIGGLRMMPFSEACAGLDRIARDAAKAQGKSASLTVEGADVEMDRAIIQKLKSPLIQLVRNAVIHGIESAASRRAMGKGEAGSVVVAATLRGTRVEVTVRDDGGGLSAEAIRAKARDKGLAAPKDEADLVSLVFHPGFSTSDSVTDFAGRGIGLDVVKTEMEALHGTVGLWFEQGKGCRFTLSLPLTLTTTRGLTVSAGGRVFAFVGTNVKQLLRVKSASFRFIEGRDNLIIEKSPIPVASLADVLGVAEEGQRAAGETAWVVVIAAGDRQMAFVVDELLAERELVVRGLGRRLQRVRNIAGAFLMETGEAALILNASELIRSALGQTGGQRLATDAAGERAKPRRHILVADDSMTTRTLEKTILESAGYEVTVAKDGREAWELLQVRGIDLVVSDVEMPGVTGFELAEKVRSSKRLSALPLILVTSRTSDEDRARGAEVGANAYLVKSAFDQKMLLQTIAQLL